MHILRLPSNWPVIGQFLRNLMILGQCKMPQKVPQAGCLAQSDSASWFGQLIWQKKIQKPIQSCKKIYTIMFWSVGFV